MLNNIALIGCGAIGNEIAKSIDLHNIPNCRISVLFDEDNKKLIRLYDELNDKPDGIFNNFDDFISSNIFSQIHFVIEAASIEAAQRYAITLLQKGKDIMIMSTGSLSNPTFSKKIIDLVKEKGRKVYLPSGAIGGADILRTVKEYINEITLVTTKSINSIKGAPFFLNTGMDVNSIVEKTTLFDGTAEEAIREFPSNVNVSALISLAGIGFHKTRVMVVVDPVIKSNQHEINVKWRFGEFYIKVNNRPSPFNPKTSYLAVLSAIECLKKALTNDIQIGS
ncbi:MAG: aspartate dehydrogenase [Thermoproteota archaeon]|nr:aspartate dehydrogenase [Thermoproteota archaeon]